MTRNEVFVVLVELGALVVAGDVLQVELVEGERLRQPLAVGQTWLVDVDPAHRPRLDDLRPRIAARLLGEVGGRTCGSRPTEAWKRPSRYTAKASGTRLLLLHGDHLAGSGGRRERTIHAMANSMPARRRHRQPF